MNITVGTSTIADLQGMVSSTFGSLLPFVVVLIAIPLTFYVIRKIIALFPKR